MSGKFVGVLVNDLTVEANYDFKRWSKKNTYICISSAWQHTAVENHMKRREIKLLYSSPNCWNTQKLHLGFDTRPNIRVWVFELNEQVSQVSTVSTMSV